MQKKLFPPLVGLFELGLFVGEEEEELPVLQERVLAGLELLDQREKLELLGRDLLDLLLRAEAVAHRHFLQHHVANGVPVRLFHGVFEPLQLDFEFLLAGLYFLLLFVQLQLQPLLFAPLVLQAQRHAEDLLLLLQHFCYRLLPPYLARQTLQKTLIAIVQRCKTVRCRWNIQLALQSLITRLLSHWLRCWRARLD